MTTMMRTIWRSGACQSGLQMQSNFLVSKISHGLEGVALTFDLLPLYGSVWLYLEKKKTNMY